jgi:hypothetical protein
LKPEEFMRRVKEYSFHDPNLSLVCSSTGNRVLVELRAEVFIDTATSTTTGIAYSQTYDHFLIEHVSRYDIEREILHLWRELMEHEFNEQIMLRGRFVHDPHGMGRPCWVERTVRGD